MFAPQINENSPTMSYSEYGWHTLLDLFFKLKSTKPTKKTNQKQQQNKCPHPNFKVPLPLTGYYLLKNMDSANRSPVPSVLDTPVNCLLL